MTILARALLLGGHFDEADALFAQADALHQRLTGGVNDEGLTLLVWRSLAGALRGDGEGALLHVERAAEIAACVASEAEVHTVDRESVRVLALATARQTTQALAGAETLQERLARLPGQAAVARVRLLRARAMAWRLAGSAALASEAAEQAVAAAAQGGCNSLEHGLALVEAARCHQGAGAMAQAEPHLRAALAVWQAGQVDGPALLQPVQAELAALPAPR